MAKFLDLTGKRFGKLTVVKRGQTKSNHVRWECACDCGNTTESRVDALRNGTAKSCGCLHNEEMRLRLKKHGHSTREKRTRTYQSWNMMMDRCNNTKNPSYKHYGERGIRVCERWHEYENFLKDMGERPAALSLERIDNSISYQPDNCCWATATAQLRNTRRNRLIEFKGKTLCLAEWAEILGVKYTTLRDRLKRLPLKQALTINN